MNRYKISYYILIFLSISLGLFFSIAHFAGMESPIGLFCENKSLHDDFSRLEQENKQLKKRVEDLYQQSQKDSKIREENNKNSSAQKDKISKTLLLYNKKSQRFNLKNLPFLGKVESPIQFHVFQDPQCTHCQIGFFDLIKMEKRYRPLIKVNFVDYPYNKSSDLSQLSSFQLTQYAKVAHEYGKYIEFMTLLFNKFKKGNYVSKNTIKKFFQALKITIPFTEIEKKAGKTKAIIDKQIAVGEKVNVSATPAIFLNGKLTGKGHKQKLIEKRLQQEIARLAKACLQLYKPTLFIDK